MPFSPSGHNRWGFSFAPERAKEHEEVFCTCFGFGCRVDSLRT
jgi:hypothetical protein